MIPDLDLGRVRKRIDQRNGDMPTSVHDQLGFEINVTHRTITVLECRPSCADFARLTNTIGRRGLDG